MGLYDDEEQTLLMMASKEQRGKTSVTDKEMKDAAVDGEQAETDEDEEAMVNFATPKRKQAKQEKEKAPTSTKGSAKKKSPAAAPKSPKGKS